MTPIELHVRQDNGESDVVVTMAEGVSVAEVFDALTLPLGTTVDGSVIGAPASTPAISVLRPGSELSVTPRSPPDHLVAGRADVAVVGGLNAGAVARLGSGLFHLAMAASPDHAGWLLQVDDLQPLLSDPAPWSQHGSSVEVVASSPTAVLAIGRPVHPEPADAWHRGARRIVNRPPRNAAAQPPLSLVVGDVPPVVREPSALSWATLLAPVPIAVMMAFFFRPIFAIFAAMGPVMALGRWWESRRRHRRDTAERNLIIAQMRAQIDGQLAEQSESEAKRRWADHPHVGALLQRAEAGSVRLWERRRGSHGFMMAILGVGPAHASPVVAHGALPPELSDLVDNPLALRPVPHVVDLSGEAAIGLVGLRNHAVAVARSLVAQLATTHGPADLRVGVLGGPATASDWDWLKWLPHLDPRLVGHSAADLVTAMPAPAGSPRREVGEPTTHGPMSLVIIDSPGADVAAVVRAANDAGQDLRCIAIAPESTRLPAVCSTIAHISTGEVRIEGQPPATASTIVPTGVSATTAESWVRRLAGVRDPELTGRRTGAHHAVSFLDVVGRYTDRERALRWANRPADAAPQVVLGSEAQAPFRIDLTADGPHALIAGTTGSGKSELLRTLVAGLAAECPPEQLNLVLVDFKGGGAFDAVSDLPHVVGLITDLDETLVDRALTGLRAELERRERQFRALAVSTFDQAVVVSGEPIARLVVVIDEFAALATDYADLMNTIVDLAARGRSLGMHLVLATQRPSGVVDQKIRANTNIRIALRVQDEFDSQDVVGTADAAHIDRKAPGAAIVRIGGDRAVKVQMAFSGALDTSHERFIVRPHRLFDTPESGFDTKPHGTETELQVVVRSIIHAAAVQESVVRPLWAPPLPARLDWIDLGTRELASSNPPPGFALGLADLPERQVQTPWRWDPSTGALGLYGASGTAAGKALISLGAAMASASGPDSLHLYVIDGDAGASSALAVLPHTGAYVRCDETDRVRRVLRLFETTLATRRTSPAPDAPDMVLVIDNLASALGAFDDVEASDLTDRLAALARDGSVLGVHVAIAARTPRDIRHRLAQQIPNRLTLELADPSGFLALGLRLRDLVPLPPMRAIDVRTHDIVQLVEPPDLSSLTSNDPSNQRVAPAIAAFPTRLDARDLPGASIDEHNMISVPIGVESVDLQPAVLPLRPGGHALIVGSPGMGCSSAAELVGRQLDRCGPPIAVARSISLAAIDQLVNAERPTVVIVDDSESLAAPIAQALEALLDANNPLLHIVACCRPDAARSVRSWISRIRSGGTGILLGGAASDGDLFRVRLGPLAGRGTIPGRGNVIDRGRATGVQLADPHAGD